MCGIAGYISWNTDLKTSLNKEILNSMIKKLHHRGPDASSVFIKKENDYEVGFAHSRLSIIDLSHGANQPMSYKHLTLVFNGEIYNYNEIKRELILLGHKFITNSDTEVVLHAFEQWNTKCIEKFIGMFAFHINDSQTNKSFFFRDRIGVKPFYVYKTDNLILYASELKALMVHPEFKKNISLESTTQYFKYGYILAPNTIFENTYQLLSGSFWEIDLIRKKVSQNTYWSVENFYNKPKSTISLNEAKEELEQILISACKYRMVSDVPVGVYLSGGFDSSLVTSLLGNHSNQQIKTFTIGFEDKQFNEAEFAKKISKHLNTEHFEHYCTEKEAIEIIPKLAYYFDEPFFDISSIPSILLAEFTKKHVTVALSTDGGVEIFAGYEIHKRVINFQKHLNQIPKSLSFAFDWTSKLLPDKYLRLKHNLKSIGDFKSSNLKNSHAFFLNVMSEKMNYESLNKFLYLDGIQQYKTIFDESLTKNFISELDELLYTDYKTYLPNNILTKVDRSSMSASLEGREPLLDHRIIEYAAQLPDQYKFDKITQKKILKEITYKYIPKEIMDRPKMGFVMPLKSWLRNDLKSYVLDNINEKSLKEVPIFRVKEMMFARNEFLKGSDHFYDLIWASLQFISWYKTWMKN